MRRFLSIFTLLFIVQLALSQTNWDLSINSFMGGAIYPESEQPTEKMIYLQKQDFQFDLDYKRGDNITLDICLQSKKMELQEVLIIQRLSALYLGNSFKIGFLKDEIGYGKNSTLFNRHFHNTYYDRFFSESFNFYGLDIFKDFDKMTAELKIGGNTFNKEIMDFSLTMGNEDYFKLFDMFVFTDNSKNKRMNSLGLEFTKHIDNFTLSGFWDNKFFISFGDNEESYSDMNIIMSRLFFTEINYKISQNFGIGYNFLQDSLDFLKHGKHTAYFSMKKGNLNADLEYGYHNFDGFFDRNVTTNIGYNFGKIKLEGMLGYSIPSIGKDRIEMGFTVGMDYAKN